jgi:pyruvate,water dikinase
MYTGRMESHPHPPFTTGLSGLDETLHGLRAGDNVVWDIEDTDEYRRFVLPFVAGARERGKKIVYFRFAEHEELLQADDIVQCIRLDPGRGFEHFVLELVDEVEKSYDTSWYVFDCLSGLANTWYSDRMMANFFLVVCPYVLRIGALAYFALFKHRHMNHATDAIYTTAQVIIETFTHDGRTYIQPKLVDQRHSGTMHLLHAWIGDKFIPVRNSAETADVVGAAKWPLLNFTIQRFGVWTTSYHEAEAVIRAVERGERPKQDEEELFERLLHMVITRQTSFLPLARKYFDLPYLMDILKRLIGSGLIGGKARGILLAQRILKAADPVWEKLLEVHDSFFIGSDVFYTYVIQNDCWWLRRKIGTFEEILERAAIARRRILEGRFLEYIELQFREMLEYFGQSPIIVRSSSLQEDSYGNAFSGKYESVFCANQGTIEQRLEEFLQAVRYVYASSLSEEALSYRLHHGLLYEDEQMALLVQRVSGDVFGRHFYPPAAGVGFSYNPFVWEKGIDQNAGVLRLAFGLGTRAVDRVEDDYTRIVALNAPAKRPEKTPEDAVRYSQRDVDLIDLEENRFTTVSLRTVLASLPAHVLDLFTDIDPEAAVRARELGVDENRARRLTFSGLLTRTDFCVRMREMLRILAEAYDHPVDIEFTVNVTDTGAYRINLVQCRPFKVKLMGAGEIGVLPVTIPSERIFLKSDGPVVGRSMAAPVDRLVYVLPHEYTNLGEQDRYAVARLVGRLTSQPSKKLEPVVMLVGPGRWGTSTPAMGVPVSFKEIRNVSIIAELAVMHKGLVPDVSLGTHFFNDLVEMDMLYFGVFPNHGGCCLNDDFLDEAREYLVELEPDDPLWAKSVVVFEGKKDAAGPELRLHADAAAQRVVCYLA